MKRAATLLEALGSVAATRPDRPALSFRGRRTTHGELWAGAAAAADALRRVAAVGSGGRVALIGLNSDRFLVAYLGILRSNAAAVPLNHLLRPEEIVSQLDIVDAGVCLVGEVDPAVRAALEARCRVVSLDGLEGDPDVALPPPDPSAVATILLTSGTTGQPKGALHTQATMLVATREMLARLPFSPQDVSIAFLPFFAAIPEQVLPTLAAGGSLEIVPRYDLAEVADACERATTFDAVPTIMARLLDGVEPRRLGRLRWVMFASEPMPPPLLERWWTTLPATRTHQFYGMTEMLTITAADDPMMRAEPRTVGTPFPASRVRILDESGRELPPGEEGEVVCASPARMGGYLPEGIDPATWSRPDGAMRTGDLGRFDGAGRLFLTGRIKDLIISGGMNVAPAEIEAVACRHPSVASAVVVGVPDPRWGETPIVVAVAAQGAQLSPAELLRHCRSGLAGYKRPTGAAIVEHFPVTGIGKSSKAEIRSMILRGELELLREA